MDNKDIVECLNSIKGYCQEVNDFVVEWNLSLEDLNDIVPFYVVTMIIEQIGEEVKKLPNDFRDRYNKVPWKDISGMRDIIAHNFKNVDKDIIFNTVIYNLPDLS